MRPASTQQSQQPLSASPAAELEDGASALPPSAYPDQRPDARRQREIQELAGQQPARFPGSMLAVQFRLEAGGPIQREEEDVLEPDIGALLDQLGFEVPEAPEVPPMSAIVAATGAELSSGTLESEIERLWRQERIPFTAAARAAAAADRPSAGGADEAHAVASPDVAPDAGYAMRWAVSMYAYNYQHGHDLPEIQALLHAGSPFRASLNADADRVIRVENPTEADFQSRLRDAILQMSMALPAGGLGEMIVHFSGHGGNGGVQTVDGSMITREELYAFASFAAEFSVHITFIIDSCLTGVMAQAATGFAAAALRPELEALPEGPRLRARELYNVLSVLQNHGTFLSTASTDTLYAARAARRARASAEDHAWFARSLAELRTRISAFGTALMGLEAGQVPDYMLLSVMQAAVAAIFMQDEPGGPRAVIRMMGQIGVLLDQLNESALALYEQLRAMASSVPAAAPETD